MTLSAEAGDDVFAGIAAGDVIRYGLDGDGNVAVISHELDWDNATVGQFLKPVDSDNIDYHSGNAEIMCYYGILTHKNGKWLNCSNEIKMVDGELAVGPSVYDCTNTYVVKFNTTTTRFEELSPNELDSYLYTVNPNVRVYVYASFSQLKSVIIYE